MCLRARVCGALERPGGLDGRMSRRVVITASSAIRAPKKEGPEQLSLFRDRSIGAPGFEPGTFGSQSRRATGLRHAPPLTRRGRGSSLQRSPGWSCGGLRPPRSSRGPLRVSHPDPCPLGSNRGPSAPKADALPNGASRLRHAPPAGVVHKPKGIRTERKIQEFGWG